MNRQWREHFEEVMEQIDESVRRKGGTKSYEKVIERVGRVKEKYPSIARFYDIEYVRNTERPKEMGFLRWKLADFSQMQSVEGVYFLRTNVRTFDEKTGKKSYAGCQPRNWSPRRQTMRWEKRWRCASEANPPSRQPTFTTNSATDNIHSEK